mmetsp:Transcript_11274/g.26534  ORF Transcript_11274/g.26534 Transcript_11274/m.26534 type:complete len:204 (-) Transcript_11274:2519-3130(-)
MLAFVLHRWWTKSSLISNPILWMRFYRISTLVPSLPTFPTLVPSRLCLRPIRNLQSTFLREVVAFTLLIPSLSSSILTTVPPSISKIPNQPSPSKVGNILQSFWKERVPPSVARQSMSGRTRQAGKRLPELGTCSSMELARELLIGQYPSLMLRLPKYLSDLRIQCLILLRWKFPSTAPEVLWNWNQPASMRTGSNPIQFKSV